MAWLTKILNLLNACLVKLTSIDSKQLSVDPIYRTSTCKKTTLASADFPAATDILLAPANPNRRGFIIYNNSTNSMYIGVASPATTGNQIGQCGSNASSAAHFSMLDAVCYTGALYVKRNSGTGSAWIVELE